VLAILPIVIHEHLSGLLIKCTLGKRNDKQAFDYFEDVIKRPRSRIPIFFESIHTDLTFLRYVGMENFSNKVAFISIKVPLGGLFGKSCSIASLHLKMPP